MTPGSLADVGRVHVISLPTAHARRQAFARLNAGLDYVFHDAIDGRAVALPDRRDLFEDGLDYTPGAYGIAATTWQLWKAVAAGDDTVTIAEDDAIFRPDFQHAAADLLPPCEPFDLVAWGYNFDSVLRLSLFDGRVPCVTTFDQDALRESIEGFRSDRGPVVLLPLLEFYGICAYSISPQGAQRMLDRCFPLKPGAWQSLSLGRPVMNTGIDVVMNGHYAGLRCYAAFPPMAVTPNRSDTSSVQTREREWTTDEHEASSYWRTA